LGLALKSVRDRDPDPDRSGSGFSGYRDITNQNDYLAQALEVISPDLTQNGWRIGGSSGSKSPPKMFPTVFFKI